MGHPFYIVVVGTIALSTHWSINHDINVTIYNGPRTKTTTLMSRLYSAGSSAIPKAWELARVMSSFLFSWGFEIFRVMSSFFRVMSSFFRVMSSFLRIPWYPVFLARLELCQVFSELCQVFWKAPILWASNAKLPCLNHFRSFCEKQGSNYIFVVLSS